MLCAAGRRMRNGGWVMQGDATGCEVVIVSLAARALQQWDEDEAVTMASVKTKHVQHGPACAGDGLPTARATR